MRYRVLALVAPLILLAAPSLARRSVPAAPDRLRPAELAPAETTRRGDAYPGVLFASAAATTTVLYETRFDLGASCTDAGWTRIDLTAQPGDFFHVDDFAGLPAAYTPLAGTKSLWCGARPQSSGPLCGYTALPGYGNGWNQAFCTKDCIAVSGDGLLDVSFLARFDSEPAYDATYLQYTLDCSGVDGWTDIDGGINVWDGKFSATIGNAYDIGTTGPVKVRIAFVSDGAWSDEDGLWNTNGAVVIDNLVAENLPLEDFEGEAPGALVATDWQSCTPPGYGNPFALFPGATQVQTDPCVRDLSCLWAAISGSTYNYACGGYPAQTAVPFVNSRGQYLQSEIVSPAIPLAGTGSEFWFEFDVYRDLPLDNLVFYQWFIRTLDGSGCPLQWQDQYPCGIRDHVQYQSLQYPFMGWVLSSHVWTVLNEVVLPYWSIE